MSASDAMAKAWQKITKDAISGSSKTKTAVSGMKSAFTSLGKSVSRLGGILTSVLGPIAFIGLAKECIELGSSVNEVQNVVDTAFGSMAYKMEQFADTAITSFGMSELAAKKTGSTYMAMAKGIGIADEEASNMAITLTGLTGDVASFFNSSQDEAATKLKSVFTGETESLKELGVVMTQTNLEQFALSKGITKSISAMTQAELATLRYNFVLNSLNLASGDFVRTQDSWANQTRILGENMKELGANIGSILTTVLLPTVKSLNELVSSLVSATSVISAAMSSIFGVQISQNSAIASSASEAAAAENALAAGISGAAAAAKKSTAGFDELNVLQSNAGGGGSGISGGGVNATISNQTTITESEAMDTAKIERAAELIKQIAGYIPVIAAGIGGLKLGKFLADLLTANIEAKTLKETLSLLGKKAGLTVGITLAITGIALEIKGISDTIQEGLNGINFAEIVGGGGLLTAGGALIGQFFGSAILGGAIGGIVAGIPAFAVGIYDAIVSGIDWLNSALIGVGATAAGAGIGAIIGMLGGPIGAGIGALIGLAVGLVTDLVILIVQNWDAIVTWCGDACAAVGQFLSDLWQGIVDIWNVCAEWFNTNVIQPVAGFFTDLWTSISNWAIGAWENIKAVFSTIGNWINSNIIQPVSNVFSGLWNGFLEKARAAWEGVKTVFGKVASFFSDTFKKAWVGIVKVFSVAGEIFNDIKDGILTAFKSIVNGIIKGLNSAIAVPFNGINWALNKIKNIEIVGITPFSGLKTISVPQIPYLAQGAVLPPNKPFMAVVGDQKHGTNIEAPLETIKQALAEVLALQEGGIETVTTINFTGDLAQLARVLKPVIDTETRRKGSSLATGGVY